MRKQDIHLKVERSHHHYRDFQKLLFRFSKSDACRAVAEHHPQTRQVIYRLPPTFAIPDDFATVAGDILQNLRSALDYLACRLVKANGQKVTTLTSFPILEDAPSSPKFEPTFTRKIGGASEEAKKIVLETKPYKGGNDALWVLHELNRRDKHRLLFTVGGYLANMGISQHVEVTNPPLPDFERMARAYASPETWAEIKQLTFPLKAGDVLWVDPPNTKVNENIKFEIQVAFNEPGVCEGEPMVLVLGKSVISVIRTVEKFAGMY